MFKLIHRKVAYREDTLGEYITAITLIIAREIDFLRKNSVNIIDCAIYH